MVQNADKIGSLVTVGNDARITRVGKVIRKVRLDEIPQLINILKGEMTFVGTRPEVKKQVMKQVVPTYKEPDEVNKKIVNEKKGTNENTQKVEATANT